MLPKTLGYRFLRCIAGFQRQCFPNRLYIQFHGTISPTNVEVIPRILWNFGDVYASSPVIGKGGLCREVILPQNLADKLETTRLDSAHTVYDRGIRYQQHYAIGGGKRWSDSFSKAADRALGWSTGAHGVRHTYAQERVIELQQQHYRFEDAKEVVSQEMGHFRADIIDTYLR